MLSVSQFHSALYLILVQPGKCNLFQCFHDLGTWMGVSWLTLSPEKTEVIIIGREKPLKDLAEVISDSLLHPLSKFEGLCLPLLTKVCKLGVWLES